MSIYGARYKDQTIEVTTHMVGSLSLCSRWRSMLEEWTGFHWHLSPHRERACIMPIAYKIEGFLKAPFSRIVVDHLCVGQRRVSKVFRGAL